MIYPKVPKKDLLTWTNMNKEKSQKMLAASSALN